MQHSRYEDHLELARAEIPSMEEIARYRQPVLRAAKNDLFPRGSDEKKFG